MNFYDTHAHSHLSFDSKEDPRNYLTDKTKIVALTDHLEFDFSFVEGGQAIPDFGQISQWQKDWEARDCQLLMGVEIGYSKGNEERLREAIAPYEMDLKLLSSHHNGEYGFMDTSGPARPEEMIDSYLTQLEEALDYFPDAQIFTHFDYGFRIFDMKEEDYKKYEARFIPILKKVIKHELAFELNSKSMFGYENMAMYEWIIPIYQELGGTLFSLGSDAHKASDHYYKFGEVIELLDKFNIESVAQFHKQELIAFPVEELKEHF